LVKELYVDVGREGSGGSVNERKGKGGLEHSGIRARSRGESVGSIISRK